MSLKSPGSSHLRLAYSKPNQALDEEVFLKAPASSHLRLAYSNPTQTLDEEVAEWGVEYEVDPDGDLMQQIVLEWLCPETDESREADRLVALGLAKPVILDYRPILPSALHRYWPDPKQKR